VGRWDDGKGGLAHRKGIRQKHRSGEVGAARSTSDLCSTLLEQIQFLLGHVSVQTTERYLGCKQRIRSAVNDRIGIEPNR
jgi:integrase